MLLFKVLIIGDAGSGKTSLMNNYLGRPFKDNDPPTIGVEFGSKIISLTDLITHDQRKLYTKLLTRSTSTTTSTTPINPTNEGLPLECLTKLQIWDTSGQERFHSIVKSYYRGVHAVIFVCDLTRKKTFDNLDFWINDYERNATIPYEKSAKILVANKADLVNEIVIDEDEIREYAEKRGMPYFIVSSKKDKDLIQEVFAKLALQTFDCYLKGDNDERERMECITNLQRMQVGKTTNNSSCCNIL